MSSSAEEAPPHASLQPPATEHQNTTGVDEDGTPKLNPKLDALFKALKFEFTAWLILAYLCPTSLVQNSPGQFIFLAFSLIDLGLAIYSYLKLRDASYDGADKAVAEMLHGLSFTAVLTRFMVGVRLVRIEVDGGSPGIIELAFILYILALGARMHLEVKFRPSPPRVEAPQGEVLERWWLEVMAFWRKHIPGASTQAQRIHHTSEPSATPDQATSPSSKATMGPATNTSPLNNRFLEALRSIAAVCCVALKLTIFTLVCLHGLYINTALLLLSETLLRGPSHPKPMLKSFGAVCAKRTSRPFPWTDSHVRLCSIAIGTAIYTAVEGTVWGVWLLLDGSRLAYCSMSEQRAVAFVAVLVLGGAWFMTFVDAWEGIKRGVGEEGGERGDSTERQEVEVLLHQTRVVDADGWEVI